MSTPNFQLRNCQLSAFARSASAGGILLTLGLTMTAQEAHKPAVLVIKAVDADTRAPIALAAAEIYVDIWGGTEPVAVPTRGSEARVQLGRDWLCAQAPVFCKEMYVAGRITLRAAGYAALSSDRFTWIGSIDDVSELAHAVDRPAVVQFPRQGSRTLRPGATETLTVRLRRPVGRTLRVVDQRGAAIRDAVVTVHETQARTNHCGAPEGVVRMQGTTNPRGEVALPGDDVEWTIGVGKEHYLFVPGRAARGRRCVTDLEGRLPAGTTTVILRRLDRRPLALEFRNSDGSPAAVEVKATTSACDCCGACDGPLGTSDAAGRFVKLDFYPDEWSEVFVSGATPGHRRWTMDPRTERWTGTKIVVLR